MARRDVTVELGAGGRAGLGGCFVKRVAQADAAGVAGARAEWRLLAEERFFGVDYLVTLLVARVNSRK